MLAINAGIVEIDEIGPTQILLGSRAADSIQVFR